MTIMSAETIIEFNQIKQQLIEYAYTKEAKEEFMNLAPILSERELLARLRETDEAKILLEKMGNPPFSRMEGIRELLQVAQTGGCLTEEELERIAMVLSAIRRLKDYLVHCKSYDVSIAYFEENLEPLDAVKEAIHSTIREGRVDDYASKELRSIRQEMQRIESRMREKAEDVMRTQKAYLADSYHTIRNGRICVPVRKEYKTKVKGSILDKSATGNTYFIEPEAVGRYYEELVLLALEEDNEVRRILYSLTAMLHDVLSRMEQNSDTIERLDVIFARARLSLSYDGVRPDIQRERRIVLKKARHPLMDRAVNVPLDFQIGNGVNGVVITGPNTGGKTVAIKTVALICMMAQCGLHVPCESAELCLHNRYLCDIGDGQNLSENLSTFSAHITNVLEILKRVDKESLVIMDELGSGTDPAEGMGIAIAILEELRKSGAFFLVTTHYPEVKQYAQITEGIQNARMTFDRETLRPLYQLIIGEAGESCAFYIASRLGMPAYMLKRAAEEAYGTTAALEEFVSNDALEKIRAPHIRRMDADKKKQTQAMLFQLGDSVMVYPEKRIGIVCQTADDKGRLRVQLKGKKIEVNHKRIKLLVKATELYPPDYDFSIVFDSVETRKLRHQMERKHTKEILTIEE
ncbi:MAG: mismatch repair protein MutS2 [Clostridiales bacterium]|nr:mismatch repair protein MutS2 [Clostridiales bacterium]